MGSGNDESGRGAVVAEEVRSLAQRSADAARSTGSLIAGSRAGADNGVKVAAEVAELLENIAAEVEKAAADISEVAEASSGQPRDIAQENTALVQFDSITQSNAASAEEAASASGQLSTQAEELNLLVGRLVMVVRGNRTVVF